MPRHDADTAADAPLDTATAAAVWDEHSTWWRSSVASGADPEYRDQILPLVTAAVGDAAEVVLDAGCGEGQAARLLAATGACVHGCDVSALQIGAAHAAGDCLCTRASVDALPYADAAFDAIVCVLVLEHVADLDGCLRGFARVLRPGGRLVVVLNHPLVQTPDSGWVDDRILEECYWRVGAYLDEVRTDEEVDKGVVLPFHHRPLSRYVNGMIDAGLRIERLSEPPPPASFLDVAPSYAQSDAIPRIAVLVAIRS
jgi:SAM-dependent methyltransferase